MDTDALIVFILPLLIILWVMYYHQTIPTGEFQSITEKIPYKVWENCTLYTTYQVCEEGKRCGWEKKLKHPVYSTVCNDGHTKTEEHIVRIQ